MVAEAYIRKEKAIMPAIAWINILRDRANLQRNEDQEYNRWWTSL